MIDLHIHSTYSKCESTPKELLSFAENKNIKYFSITDHNCVDAYSELDNLNINDYYTGKLIVGCEFICMYNGVRIDVLGYKFDYKVIKNWLKTWYSKEKYADDNTKQFEILYQKCKEKNIKIDSDLVYDPNKEFPMYFIYNEIIKYKENEKLIGSDAFSKPAFFYRHCTANKNFILYHDYSLYVPSLEELSKLVRTNGGLLFLAHPYGYKIEDLPSFLDELTSSKLIDGLECYHSLYLDERKTKLLDYCHKNNLLISGGSDYHIKKDLKTLGIKIENINFFNWI